MSQVCMNMILRTPVSGGLKRSRSKYRRRTVTRALHPSNDETWNDEKHEVISCASVADADHEE